MKIALLFTGRSNNFNHAAAYLGKVFNHVFDTVDIFAHDWDDDFRRMIDNKNLPNGTAPTVDFMSNYLIPKKNTNVFPLLQKCFDSNTIKYRSTSQKEMIELAAVKSNQQLDNNTVQVNDFLFYIMSIAQLASYNSALELWKDHVTETGERYDAVIRWRYDLLIPHISHTTKKLLCSVKDNDVMFPDVQVKNQMLCDYSWVMNHDTAFNHGSKIYTEFKETLDERYTASPVGKDKSVYKTTENMLLVSINRSTMNAIGDPTDGAFSPVIWRTGCATPFIDITTDQYGSVTHTNDNIYDIARQARDTWINKGWNERVTNINTSGMKSDF